MIIEDIDKFYKDINRITDDRTYMENQIRIPNINDFMNLDRGWEPDDTVLWDNEEQE